MHSRPYQQSLKHVTWQIEKMDCVNRFHLLVKEFNLLTTSNFKDAIAAHETVKTFDEFRVPFYLKNAHRFNKNVYLQVEIGTLILMLGFLFSFF